MASTPRHQRSERNPGTPSSKKPLNGLWDEEEWWCNCEPRRKAVMRQVKKSDSRYKGKFFFTCAATSKRCDFFLWQEEAAIRQTGLSTPQKPVAAIARPKTPTLTQRNLSSYGISPSKRKRVSEADDDDFLGDDDFNSDEERQLAALTDRSAEKAKGTSAANTVYETPIAQRTILDDGLPTPATSRNLFPRSKTVSFSEENGPSSSATTNTLTAATPQTPSDNCDDLHDKVMTILRGQSGLDAKVLQSVNDLLITSSRRSKGIVKGRDSARDALKEKETTIVKLNEKVVQLENQVTMLDKHITKMKKGMMEVYQNN